MYIGNEDLYKMCNFGTISNTTVNINGSSLNYHYNSSFPFGCSWGYGSFTPGCFGFGFGCSPYMGFGCSPKAMLGAGLGLGLGLALPNIVGGIVNLFRRN